MNKRQEELRKKIVNCFGDERVEDGGIHALYDGKWIDVTTEVDSIESLINSEVRAALDRLKETDSLSWRSMNFNNIDSYDSAFEQGADKQHRKFIDVIEEVRKDYE